MTWLLRNDVVLARSKKGSGCQLAFWQKNTVATWFLFLILTFAFKVQGTLYFCFFVVISCSKVILSRELLGKFSHVGIDSFCHKYLISNQICRDSFKIKIIWFEVKFCNFSESENWCDFNFEGDPKKYNRQWCSIEKTNLAKTVLLNYNHCVKHLQQLQFLYLESPYPEY